MGLGALRNELCHCGSGKKFKFCHYFIDDEFRLHPDKFFKKRRGVPVIQDILLAYQQQYITNEEAKRYVRTYFEREFGADEVKLPEATVIKSKAEDDNKEV